jgi:hypothetical protein
MNPIAIMLAAASAVMGFGLMVTSNPETDTAGLVSESTVYSPPTVGLEPLPDASGSDYSVVTPQVQYTGPGCREWADLAVRSGFAFDDLWIALQVMELESMCLPDAIGDNGQSYGLMQINSFWCTPSTYWPRGYLQTNGFLDQCQQLLDPALNIYVAWHISTQYGWENWSTYDRIVG